jgi:hypothetical protein
MEAMKMVTKVSVPRKRIEKLFNFVQELRGKSSAGLALLFRDAGKRRSFRVVVGQLIGQEHFQQRLVGPGAAVAGFV